MRPCPVCAIFIALSDGNNWRAVTCNYARGISYQLKLTTDVIWQYANEEIGFRQFSRAACKCCGLKLANLFQIWKISMHTLNVEQLICSDLWWVKWGSGQFSCGNFGHLAVIIWASLCNNISLFLIYQLCDATTSRHVDYDISWEFIS